MVLLYTFRPIKKILFFLLFFLLTANAFASLSVDQVKAYVTTVANGGSSKLIPPPAGLADDLVTYSSEYQKGGVIKHIDSEYQRLQQIARPSGKTPRKILALNREKLDEMWTAVETKENSDLKAILEEEKRLTETIKKDAIERKDKNNNNAKDTDLAYIKMLFDRYQAGLKALSKQSEGLNKCYNTINENQLEIVHIRNLLLARESIIRGYMDGGTEQCTKAKEKEARIMRFSAEVKAGESLVEETVNIAKNRFSTCKTAVDKAFINSTYNVGQKYFVETKSALSNANTSLESLANILDVIEQLNIEIKESASETNRGLPNDYYKLVKADDICINTLKANISPTLDTKLTKLKQEIIATKQNYSQYPNEIQVFDTLITRSNTINNTKHISENEIESLERRNLKDGLALTSLPRRGEQELIPCISIKPSIERVKEAEGLHFNALLILQDNKHLAGACAKQNTPAVVVATSPSTIPPVPSTASVTSQASTTAPSTASNIIGGLVIAGPSELTEGDGVAYIATDREGKPYTSGSFSWNHSREDLMSLGHSGNPVSGVGFKAGKLTIIMHYDGATVFKDVTIKKTKKKKNIFSMSSIDQIGNTDPSKNTKTNNLFSVSSIEQESTTSESNCDTYYQEAKNAFNYGNLDAAQAAINKAAGCGEWVGAAQSSVNKAKKDKLCSTIAALMDAAFQANNADAIVPLQKQAGENQCNISQTIWQNGNSVVNARDDARRDEERNNQNSTSRPPQQPNQNANMIDLLNIAVQGINAIRQPPKDPEDRKPPSTGSGLNSLGGRTWQGPNGVITGSNGSTWNNTNNTTSSGGASQSQGSKPQSQSSTNHSIQDCKGHSLKCGKGKKYTVDRDFNMYCDICRLRVKFNSKTLKVIRNPNGLCNKK